MNTRIGSSSDLSQAKVQGNSLQEKKDKEAFKSAIEVNAPVIRESFITSVMGARQPPRMPLGEVEAATTSDVSGSAFANQIDALTRMSDSDIAGGLADIYLNFVKDAQIEGGPQLSEAFDYLGEVLVNYEHLRMLRTGELG